MSVTNSIAKNEASAVSPPSLETMEQLAQETYRPPGHPHTTNATTDQPPHEVEWVRNTDGTPLIDHRGRAITVDRMLATKPLRGELSTRPGPGNRKLTYLSGEGVTRTLNDIFGFDGWNLDIKKTQREECVKDDKGRFHVAYTATVRLTHRKSGAYKEDCGAGDSIDRSMGTAIAHALKASITDAMKRAARHFGDKLGNCTCLW
jgi:DNA repair and recombination protein RAD52